MIDRVKTRLDRLFGYQKTASAYRRKLGDLGDPDTVLILTDLARELNYRKTTIVPGDALGTAFEEGKREAFLYITRRSKQDSSAVEEAINEELTNGT
jgi:hypothetical protein